MKLAEEVLLVLHRSAEPLTASAVARAIPERNASSVAATVSQLRGDGWIVGLDDTMPRKYTLTKRGEAEALVAEAGAAREGRDAKPVDDGALAAKSATPPCEPVPAAPPAPKDSAARAPDASKATTSTAHASQILAIRPGGLAAVDREALRQAGVVVIECENLANIRFLGPTNSFDAELLTAAMTVLLDPSCSSLSQQQFGQLVAQAITARSARHGS